MGISGGLTNPPLILTQPRWRASLIIAVGISTVCFGEYLGPRWTIDMIVPAEHFLVGLGFIIFVIGVVFFIKPAKLILAPSGIRLDSLTKQEQVAWNNVATLRYWAIGRRRLSTTNEGVRGVVVVRRMGPPLTLPAGWNLGPEQLAELLIQARKRWLR